MKKLLLSRLRDKNLTTQDFRRASDDIATLLAYETLSILPHKLIDVTTPLEKTDGKALQNQQVIIPILRAGLSMLPAFLKVLPEAKVGFYGMRRDEKTFEAKLYYENIPPLSETDDIIIIDPMIATAGSARVAVQNLVERGVKLSRITYVGIIASKQGLKTLRDVYPDIKIIVASTDEKLDHNKFIVPGLGDYGDRYFGT